MILPDDEIELLARENNMIIPYSTTLQNPASYDVRLSSEFLTEEGNRFTILDELIVRPGEFFLGGTMEIFNLPDDVGAFFALKSSLARQGLTHNMAGWCDPGWNNSILTMELGNATKHSPIILKPSQRVGQMVFMRLTSRCRNPYDGRYSNDKKVMGAKKGIDFK